MPIPAPAPSLVPTLDDLRSALGSAEIELTCADMIDDGQRRRIEMARWSQRVTDLKAQIAQMEEI